mmetsp:Transcript_169203/g.543981  ORF Transcript_169203/g.543981 Transcript_169203/m.543981 type:complete len:248 (-) Transcript_169203:38-781(-)
MARPQTAEELDVQVGAFEAGAVRGADASQMQPERRGLQPAGGMRPARWWPRCLHWTSCPRRRRWRCGWCCSLQHGQKEISTAPCLDLVEIHQASHRQLLPLYAGRALVPERGLSRRGGLGHLCQARRNGRRQEVFISAAGVLDTVRAARVLGRLRLRGRALSARGRRRRQPALAVLGRGDEGPARSRQLLRLLTKGTPGRGEQRGATGLHRCSVGPRRGCLPSRTGKPLFASTPAEGCTGREDGKKT